MVGVCFDGREAVLRMDLPQPTPREGEALLRVRRAGVCRTDLEILRGYMRFTGIMGHEFVGEVVQGPSPWPGRRVAAEINCPCGACEFCAAGLGNHCPTRTVLGIDGRDGAFAEYVCLPAANLHKVPDGVSDDQAVFTEPLAAAFQIPRQVEIGRDTRIAVLGDGRLGLLCAMVLQKRTSDLILIGRHPAKLALGRRRGIPVALAGEVRQRRAYHVVVDATGSAEGFEAAMRLVRPRGTIVLKSTFAGGGLLNLAPLVVDEVRVVGSRCGPFPDALKALASGEIDPTDLISARYPLRDGLAALRQAAQPECIKVILDMV